MVELHSLSINDPYGKHNIAVGIMETVYIK